MMAGKGRREGDRMTAWPYPFWIAHRGAGKLAPENTLAAFRLGASHGFRAFECDVKLSADGVPFLLHDARLERTTGESGDAGRRTWSELSRLDAGGWHSPAFAGEPLPSLAAVAAYCLRNGFALNLEIKPTPGADAATARVVADQVARTWRSADPKPLLSSFSTEALAAVRHAEPNLPRALLLDQLRTGWREEATALGCLAIVMHHPLLDGERVAQVHEAGMRALAYTVNDAATVQRLRACGIDGLITDAVDRFSEEAQAAPA
jgi:glycerophosphoryl diester phosphodiesterase